MKELQSENNGGLYGLAGFAYQIKAFVLQMVHISPDQQVEFETIDDVAIRSAEEFDIQEDRLKGKVISNRNGNTLELFQVKRTEVTAAKSYRILYNWLIELNQVSPLMIEKFVLLCSKQENFSGEAFNAGADFVFDKIIKTTKTRKNSIEFQAKQLYFNNRSKFFKDYQYIIDHIYVEEMEDIDKEIIEKLSIPLHMDPESMPFYFSRVKELLNKVTSRILDSVSKTPPEAYICSYREYLQICEEVTRNIADESYTPDYISFSRVHEVDIAAPEIVSSREFRQLLACKLRLPSIKKHLSYNQYYQDIRFHYFEDNKLEKVERIEMITRDNFDDVVAELQEEGKDKPATRLRRTKDKSNSEVNEFGRWGSCVYLTGDNVEDSISWEDEENGGS